MGAPLVAGALVLPLSWALLPVVQRSELCCQRRRRRDMHVRAARQHPMCGQRGSILCAGSEAATYVRAARQHPASMAVTVQSSGLHRLSKVPCQRVFGCDGCCHPVTWWAPCMQLGARAAGASEGCAGEKIQCSALARCPLAKRAGAL